ncbi:hypothetical protein Apmu_0171_11 [Acidiphilium multivorum AIU301]|nr:hypothetical protein Apmu_0171_11 [Acidiphilium multivorum AIU301]
MLAGEGDMVGRVPVLRDDDRLVVPRKSVDHRHHHVAIRYGKGTSGAKICLDIDDEKRGAAVHIVKIVRIGPAR